MTHTGGNIGQVGIVTGNPGWYGRAVQFFTRSPAFHTVIGISDTVCVSAITPRVTLDPIGKYDGILWTSIPLTGQDAEQVVDFACEQVGKPYAYLDILFILVTIVTGTHTPRWVTRRLQKPDRWFCSELCDAALLHAGINLFPGRPDCAVTPADFYQAAHREAVTQ